MADDIQSIKEKVRALLMKAADAAASPAEAEGAMRLAQKLMAKYQVSEADLGSLKDDDWKEYQRATEFHKTKGTYVHPIDRYCAVVVGKFCGVVPYTKPDASGNSCLTLFGLESDVEMANWMLAAFRQQMEHDWEIYKRFQMDSKRLLDIKEARLSFVKGFAEAVNKRLGDWMFRDEANSPTKGTSDGRDLVIRKNNLALDEMKRRGFSLGPAKHRGRSGNDTAAAGAGYNSGNAARMGGQAVGGSRIMIGG